MTVVVVDCAMGNVGSILNMFRRIGVPAIATGDPEQLAAADKLLLPGVGAFDAGMRRLRERGLLPVLHRKVVEESVPILGICLGMQLLTEGSEEGTERGLGWIRGRAVRFRAADLRSGLKIPHMGWNTVALRRPSPLFADLDDDHGFYFVHSYHVECDEADDVLATTHHGYEFVSSVQRGNIHGTQFHPEKSHRFGLRLLKNFAELG